MFFFRLQNLLVRWCYSFCCALSQRKRKVMVFHEVQNEISSDRSCCIRTSTFRDMIDREEKHGVFIKIDDLFKSAGKAEGIVITFDDVPHSFLENAYPILKSKSIPFTLFICKKFVGKDGFLSENEIKELDKDSLCTIGAHTTNHVRLRNEAGSKEDIIGSKKYLEDLLHHEVKYFAYPYGRYDSVSKANRKEVQGAGFFAAFSTIPTDVPPKCDKYFVPRIELIK